MPDYTPNLNLYLPGGGGSGTIPDEIADIDKLNENFRTIDASLGGTIVPAVAGYTNRFNGNLIYARNEKKLYMESLADFGLLDISPGANLYRGTPAERAAFAPAPDGAVWKDTDARGKEWVGVGSVWTDTVFGHAGRTAGIQSGAGVTVIAAQELSGGVTLSGNGLTVPVAGLYRITFSIFITGGSAYKASGEVRVNGTQLKGVSTYKPNSDDLQIDGTVTKTLAKDDVVTVYCAQGTYGTNGYNGTFIEVERIG